MENSWKSSYGVLDLSVRKKTTNPSTGPKATSKIPMRYSPYFVSIQPRNQSISPELKAVNIYQRCQSTSPDSFRSDSSNGESSSSQSSLTNQCRRPAMLPADPRNAIAFGNGSDALLADLWERTSKILEHRPANVEDLRRQMTTGLRRSNNHTNQNMRRVSSANENKSNDPLYLEKRRKNNESAKRSRDARKAKEEDLMITNATLSAKAASDEALIAEMAQIIKQLKNVLFPSSETVVTTTPPYIYRPFSG